MPNAVCSLLRESGVRDLGVHTEMLTDGIVDLYRAGVVTGARKTLHPARSSARSGSVRRRCTKRPIATPTSSATPST